MASAALALLERLAPRERELAERGPEWLRRLRGEGRRRFAEIGLPTPRDEDWRGTNVAPIAGLPLRAALPAPLDGADLPAVAGLDLGGARLVFVDGNLRPELSAADPAPGLWAGSLARALDEIPARVQPLLRAVDTPSSAAFGALNTAFLDDGAVVLVERDRDVERPVLLLFVSTARDGATVSQPRVLIATDAGSRVRVVEAYAAAGDGEYFTNAVTDLTVGDNAEVDHCRLQLEGPGGYHVSTMRTQQSRSSRLVSHNVDLGGRFVRHDLLSVLDGEGAHCVLDGLYLTAGQQHVDNHTTLDHARPHGDSRELYKGILFGRSRAVFNGRIIVRPGAQKTDAKQSNRNLLVSDAALANTRPQLEIYADDVKCTHGATVGRLDEDALFYLCSRGIGREEARRVLIRAFADEVLDRIPVAAVRELLAGEIGGRLRQAAPEPA